MKKFLVISLVLIVLSTSACSKAAPDDPVQASNTAQAPVAAEMNHNHDEMAHMHDDMAPTMQEASNVADECCIELARKFVEHSLVWNIEEMKKITSEDYFTELKNLKSEVATPSNKELNHSSKDMRSEKIDDSTIRIVFSDYDVYTCKAENKIEHSETTRELILDNINMIVKGYDVKYNIVKTEKIL